MRSQSVSAPNSRGRMAGALPLDVRNAESGSCAGASGSRVGKDGCKLPARLNGNWPATPGCWLMGRCSLAGSRDRSGRS
jgi:hypothetical protein